MLTCDSTDSPFTWGTLQPRVVLPVSAGGWSAERARNVLVHELHHVRRFDWLKLVLQNVVAALYWFNPLVWFAIRQCRFEAERDCDDSVLLFGGRSSEYAEQLVDLMTSSGASRNAAVALGDGYFVRRIRANRPDAKPSSRFVKPARRPNRRGARRSRQAGKRNN